MTLEWLRRRDPVLDRHLRTYLFTTEPVTEVEAEAEAGARRRRVGLARDRQPEGNRLMDHLYRDLAPISEAAWSQIEDEAKSRLVTYLAARKLVDVDGPHGWGYSATDLGRVDEVDSPSEGVRALRRRVRPVVELRAGLRRLARGARRRGPRERGDIELPELDEAVRQIALAENVAVFHGYAAAGILGITEESSHPPSPSRPTWSSTPKWWRRRPTCCASAGIGGPYGLAIDPAIYTGDRGDGRARGLPAARPPAPDPRRPVVWAPGVEGGVVLSQRGGDFVLHIGQDLSIGYRDHDADVVRLYVEESFSFRVLEPDAAVALTRA